MTPSENFIPGPVLRSSLWIGLILAVMFSWLPAVILAQGEGRGPGLTVRARTVTPLSLEAWSHLVAVVDRQACEVRLFLNGKAESKTPIPKTMTQGIDVAGTDISIPSRYKPFHGLLGDFRIYGQAVSAERVKELFRKGARRYSGTAFHIKE